MRKRLLTSCLTALLLTNCGGNGLGKSPPADDTVPVSQSFCAKAVPVYVDPDKDVFTDTTARAIEKNNDTGAALHCNGW